MIETISTYIEPHRPQLHFSPAVNWINDPNGLLYYQGVYHLFYQYNPTDKAWSNMSWGHATSTDMLHWQHKGVAIPSEPEGLGYIFSGSAVVDSQNTSGLQQTEHPPLVAIFTHSSVLDQQVQSIAYSVDGGDSWQSYAANPVLINADEDDFRDPKVFWHEASAQWIMLLAVANRIDIYGSESLLEWQFLSSFGENEGAHGGVWECPDLFELTCGDVSRWVLLVSINPGGPNGGSAMQYFVGDFDGVQFSTEQTATRWLEYSADFYAGVTWNNIPANDGRRLLIAWMSNWRYAGQTPTRPWRGAMTLPRELYLYANDDDIHLGQRLVSEVKSLRTDRACCQMYGTQFAIKTSHQFTVPKTADIQLKLEASSKSFYTISLTDEFQKGVVIEFNFAQGLLVFDRSQAAQKLDNNDAFITPIVVPIASTLAEALSLRIILDWSSIEIFDERLGCLLTAQFFAEGSINTLAIQNQNDEPLYLDEACVYELDSVWHQTSTLEQQVSG